MGTRTSTPILLLACVALSALNIGCGAGFQQPQPGSPPNLASASVSTPAPADYRNASQPMQSPVLGFAYAGGEVRAILGIPGASILSRPLALPEGVTSVSFAPGQKYAIVEGASGASIGLMTFPTADPGPLIQIGGGISQPDIVSFSPNGAAAVVYSTSEGCLQVIAGLPDSPQVTRDMSRGTLPDGVRLLGWLTME